MSHQPPHSVFHIDPVDGTLVFIIGLLVGGLAIYAAGRVVTDVDDFGQALLTALVGSIVWLLFGWIPLLGSLLALLAWLTVIRAMYPGGWLRAGAVGAAAWAAAVVASAALGLVGIHVDGVVGVPGV